MCYRGIVVKTDYRVMPQRFQNAIQNLRRHVYADGMGVEEAHALLTGRACSVGDIDLIGRAIYEEGYDVKVFIDFVE